MKQLLFATTNKGKVQTMQRDLASFGIDVIQESMNIPEPRSDDVQEIADHKVRYACKQLKQPVVVLDAGFYIDSLNGFPRAFVNFTLQTIGLEGILRLVDGKNRQCEFRECLAYLDQTLATPKFFIAHIRGTLAPVSRGTLHDGHWSALALVFIPDGVNKTLAEMSREELDEWRAKSGVKDPHAKEFPKWFLQHDG